MATQSEAQRIVDELIDRVGMQGAAIAREIGVKSDTIQNIRRRHSTGNLQVQRLRILRDQMLSAAGLRQATPGEDIPTQPVADQLPTVDDLLAAVKEPPEPAAFDLNAEEPAPAPDKKITERASDWLRAAMLGSPVDPSSPGMTAPSRAKKTKGEGVEQGELVEQIVPLAALLLVVSGSVLLPDPYKPCGPRHEEATAMVYPIVKRAVRELDARRKLSEATTDAIAILLAVGAYGVRAHATYQAIHAEEVQRVRSQRESSPVAAASSFVAGQPGSGGPAAPSADAGAGAGVQDASGSLPFWRGDARVTREAARPAGRSASGGPASQQQRSADALIDDLLRQDRAGRQRLGL